VCGLDRPAPLTPSVTSQYGYALTFDDLPLTEEQFARAEQYMRDHHAELQRYDAGESWKLAEAHARGRRPEAMSAVAADDSPLSPKQVLRHLNVATTDPGGALARGLIDLFRHAWRHATGATRRVIVEAIRCASAAGAPRPRCRELP